MALHVAVVLSLTKPNAALGSWYGQTAAETGHVNKWPIKPAMDEVRGIRCRSSFTDRGMQGPNSLSF